MTTRYVDCEAVAYSCVQSDLECEELSARKAASGPDYAPVLFSARNKPDPLDNLLLCFGALAIWQVVGTLPEVGKLIYGECHRCKTVTVVEYVVQTQRIIDEISLIYQQPPRLVLNKHCTTCDFQSRCLHIAADRDDLSQLATISPKERTKYNEKGIFTITQLSYGYRPRRRKSAKSDTKHTALPPRQDHKLKALAIKKAQIHVVGAPTLKILGTPVFLDVEGMPDRDFYYLIGLRFERAGDCGEHSFWANGPDDERSIWGKCLQTLKEVENPQIVHYGSYENRFLRKMKERHPLANDDREFVDRLIDTSINLASCIYGKIYFPTHSNSLKDIGRYLGFSWTWLQASGSASVLLRRKWEIGDADDETKHQLITYNIEDCRAAEVVAEALVRICEGDYADNPLKLEAVNVSSLEVGFQRTFGKFAAVLPEFAKINSAAYWDYQRSKVYIRTDKKIRQSIKKSKRTHANLAVDKEANIDDPLEHCPKCHSENLSVIDSPAHLVFDLRFTGRGIKRWVVRYHYQKYKCHECSTVTTSYHRDWQYGPNFRAYVTYLLIEMRLSYQKISDHITSLFNLPVRTNTPSYIKYEMANKYEATYRQILTQITQGSLVHADETKAGVTKGAINGGGQYMWVFTNLTSVAYVHAETREAAILEEVLKGFSGVLVSDFYAAYNSVPCAQQKCLIHLMRDINEQVCKNPFNEELASIARGFGDLLREIVETIDTYGLKARHLRKHKRPAASFIENVITLKCKTEAGSVLRTRIEKNKGRLFTFLEYDNVPWNNNNAEHAIHAYVKLRNGLIASTPKERKNMPFC